HLVGRLLAGRGDGGASAPCDRAIARRLPRGLLAGRLRGGLPDGLSLGHGQPPGRRRLLAAAVWGRILARPVAFLHAPARARSSRTAPPAAARLPTAIPCGS